LHNVWDTIVADLGIPAIHIGDAVADALRRDARRRVALLGTSYTMTLPFLRERIEERGIEVTIPAQAMHARIDETILHEFSRGVFSDEARRFYVDTVSSLDADAVVLACTELGLLLAPDDLDVPVYDTARVHAAAAVDYALNDA
jgi:aspartate racemase